ncbi:MAG TPA: ubiquinone/menaquinone biosynthesis methyltransferase [Acidimicrobiia bacterium]|nr:ubiquinone/menaquinone biosynthesis methyltransferase [Acidimicrobiia bacterium]
MTRTAAPARHARLPEGDDKQHAVEAMFDRIAPRYDRLNRIISLGQDQRWRRHTVAALGLSPGATVLDLGCGTGDLCDVVTADGYAAIGVDFSAGMLAAAHTRAPLARADALALPAPDASVDGVVSGFALRNFVDLPRFFRECARVLRPGGRLAALETGEPASPLLRAGHHLWFRRVVPLVGARLAHDAEAYRYLPRSTAYLPPPGDLLALVEAAGFAAVERRTFTAGAVQLLTGTRR